MKKNLWDDSFLGHFLKRYLFLTVLFFTIGVWGQYTYTFPTTSTVYTNGSSSESKTLGAYSWTLTTNPSTANFRGFDSVKGQQFGSGSSPASSATLSTSGISGTITAIKITTSGASSVVGTVGVTVGGTAFTPSSASISAASTEYTFTGSASGTVVISWNQTSSKALYIAKLDITYFSGYTVTYDGNGNTGGTVPTDTNSYASGATVTAKTNSGSLVKTGYIFANWNTLANGTGTNYVAGTGTFTITSNTTLFAKWISIPAVNSVQATGITANSASSGGNVTADGGASVTSRGVVWDTNASPTILLSTKTSDGTGTGSYISSLSSLSVNTKYYYRAYATNSVGTAYGTEYNFYTLANVPSAPVVSSPTSTSLNVAVGAGDGNPGTTAYAIYETTTSRYVQSDGTLAPSAAWQTASSWGTKTVSGLTAGTTYTFQVKARNGDTTPAETGYGLSTNGTTSANVTVDYGNLQHPPTLSVDEGNTSALVYAQAYKAGVTDVAGNQSQITVWIGVSLKDAPANSNPDSWVTWIPAAFDSRQGNNYQYSTTINTVSLGLTPGVYRYASRFQMGTGSYYYGGYNSGQWNGTSNISGILTVNSNLVDGGQVTLYPASPSEGTASTATLEMYEPGLTNVTFQNTNVTVQFAYVPTTDSNPNSWTGWTNATGSSDAGNNDKYTLTLPSNLTPGTYYVAARARKTGSTEWQYFGSNWNTWTNSAVLTVQSNKVNWANIQSPISGTIVIGGSYTVYSQVYKPGVTGNANPHSGINAWIGYSTTNNDPSSSAGWTWVPATRNNSFSDASNDEYFAEIGSGRTAGVYYYASRYQMMGSSEYFYGGHNDAPNTGGAWNGTTSKSGTLIVQTPREINIKQGSTQLNTNANYTFPDQISGTSSTAVTFTVENTGQENLTVGALSISGTNADQFSITQSASSTVTGNSSTTFTVTFSPTSVGSKTAQLSLVNNDADENPYVINISGTGTASAVSDIVAKSGYTYPQNIAYVNYQATDITGGANDIEIAKFTIRDGGATADADNLGTTLTQLSFSLTNSTNIRRVAIYDGSTEIAEQAGSTNPVFSVLNLTAPDGGTKDFSIRVSFNTAVTDNQQISINITSTTTAASTGSAFVNTSAGAASTSTAGDNNRIEVTADRLAFTTQPANASVNTNLATFTIKAQDINANVDLDANNAISLSTSGTGMTASSSYAMSSGAVNISDVQYNAVQTAITITGTTTGLSSSNSVTSSAFNIASYSNGDYRTLSDGTWHSTTGSGTALWEQFNGSIWNSVTAPATNTQNKVYIKNNISLVGTNTAGNVIIENGGILTTTISSTFGNLLVKDGGIFNREGNGSGISGVFEVLDGGQVTLKHTNTTSYATTIWAGTEKFHPNSIFIIKSVNSTATPIVANSSVVSSYSENGVSALFGNLIIDCSAGKLQLVYSGFNDQLTAKDLILRTNSDSTPFSAGDINTTIGRNLIIESTYSQAANFSSSGTNIKILVKGDFIHNASNNFRPTSSLSANSIFSIDGNMSINGSGSFLPNGGSGTLTGSSVVNLKGNLKLSASAGLYSPVNGTHSFNFNGFVNQTVDIANTNTLGKISFNVNNNAYVTLANNNLSLNNTSITVASGGKLDNGGELQFIGASGTNTISISNGGTFITRDAQGFAGTNAAIPAIVPTLAAGSTVDYEGADQVLTVTPDYSNLRLAGTGSKSVSGSVNVNKDLAVISGATLSLTTPMAPAVSSVTVTGAVSNSGTITVNNDANFVQKTGSTYSGAGTFTVLREAKVPSTQFNYWSSPIFGSTSSGQNMYSIYPNIPANRVQIYNTANDRFVTVPNPTYGAPGIGYSIKGPSTNTSSSAVTATFTGTTPNNGDVSVALNRVGYNYNLVGNPYPSNIDLNTFYSDNTAVLANGTFWLWDNTNNTELTQLGTTYTGNSYATWNASSGTGVKGTSTTNSPAKTPTQYATVAQGFIVEANPLVSGSLVFKNSERVTNAGVFFASKNTTENDAYWLELLTPAGVINTQAIVYSADAVNTLDKFDSGLGILGSDSFYSFADGNTSELIIQGRKGAMNTSDVVPLGAVSFSSGNHTIRLSDKKGIFESGQKIYLHDKLINQYHDLTAGDYTFNLNKGTVNNRFEIVYKDAAVLGNSDLTKSDFRIYRHLDQYVVESSKMLGKVELYDAGGRLVTAFQTNSKKLKVDMTLLPNGVYVIKAENSGDLKTKKIRK